jgi:small membrane protein
MHLILIQVVVVLFAVYAAGRSISRFRKRTIGMGELAVWVSFWLAMGVCVMLPNLATKFANLLGVGRGADALFYLSIIGLSYAFFRLYTHVRHMEQQTTALVRRLAIEKCLNEKREPTSKS